MRFTSENRQQVLDDNEGFTVSTYYEGNNFREFREYTISDGKLVVKVSGKTSWADSRYSDEYVYGADDEETKRSIEVFRKQIETIYVKRFGLGEEQVKDIMDGEENLDGTFFTADQAVEAGIIPASHIIETEKAVTDRIGDVLAEAKTGKADLKIREIFSGVAAEISNDKLIEWLDTIHDKNSTTKYQQSMSEKDFSEIVAQLGLPNDATAVAVSAKLTELLKAKSELTALQDKHSELEIKFAGKETEVSNLQTKLDEAQAALNTYKDAEAAALKAEIEAVVDAAIAAGKITAEAKESWIQMANTNFDTVKSTLASIEGRKVLTQEIANDPSNVKHAQDAMTEAEQIVQAEVKKVVGDFELKKF